MTSVSEPSGDWTKTIVGLDLTKGPEELLNMLAKLKIPGINMDALVASERDNLEALAVANRVALEGIKAAGQWQMKLLQETMQEMTEAMGRLVKGGSPQQMVTTETELAKKAFEAVVRQMRELAEIVTKANEQATDAIVKRIPESLDEIKDVFKIEQPPRPS